jgi:hypothetical protein
VITFPEDSVYAVRSLLQHLYHVEILLDQGVAQGYEFEASCSHGIDTLILGDRLQYTSLCQSVENILACNLNECLKDKDMLDDEHDMEFIGRIFAQESKTFLSLQKRFVSALTRYAWPSLSGQEQSFLEAVNECPKLSDMLIIEALTSCRVKQDGVKYGEDIL